MKKHILTVAILGAFMSVPFTAYAGGHTVDRFLEADSDKNGSVSKDEFVAKYNQKFITMDSNADESVSVAEYESYIEKKYEEKRKKKFQKMDSNGDGMVSFEEMSASMKSSKHHH